MYLIFHMHAINPPPLLLGGRYTQLKYTTKLLFLHAFSEPRARLYFAVTAKVVNHLNAEFLAHYHFRHWISVGFAVASVGKNMGLNFLQCATNAPVVWVVVVAGRVVGNKNFRHASY